MGLKVTHIDEPSKSVTHPRKLTAGKKPKDFTHTTETAGASAASLSGAIAPGGKAYKLSMSGLTNSFNATDLRETASFLNELADTLAA